MKWTIPSSSIPSNKQLIKDGFWHCGSPHYTFKPPKSSRQTLSFSHHFLTTKIRGERVKPIRSCGGPQIRGPKVKTIENCGSLGVPNGMSPHLHPAIDFWRPESRTSGPRKAVRCSRANFRRSEMSPFTSMGWQGKGLHQHLEIGCNMGMGQNLVPLVNIKIAGKWMFIPPKMVLIGIDAYPYGVIPINFLLTVPESSEFWLQHRDKKGKNPVWPITTPTCSTHSMKKASRCYSGYWGIHPNKS